MALAGLGTALATGLKSIGGKIAGSKLGTMATQLGKTAIGSKAFQTLGDNFKSGMSWSGLNNNNKILPALAMIGSTTAQQPGRYYVRTNWKGNGLADTGIGYLSNPKYQNPYDQANLLIDLFTKRNTNNLIPSDTILSKYDDDFSQAGNWFNTPDYNYTGIDTTLNTKGFVRPEWLGGIQ